MFKKALIYWKCFFLFYRIKALLLFLSSLVPFHFRASLNGPCISLLLHLGHSFNQVEYFLLGLSDHCTNIKRMDPDCCRTLAVNTVARSPLGIPGLCLALSHCICLSAAPTQPDPQPGTGLHIPLLQLLTPSLPHLLQLPMPIWLNSMGSPVWLSTVPKISNAILCRTLSSSPPQIVVHKKCCTAAAVPLLISGGFRQGPRRANTGRRVLFISCKLWWPKWSCPNMRLLPFWL